MRRLKQLALAGAWIPLLLLVALVAPGSGTGLAPSARAEVTGEVPTFSNPLEFTHPFFPYEPGAMKVFSGTEDDLEVTIVERHLTDIRMFPVEGREVPCAVFKEVEFVHGELVEVSYNYYAQADDGSVWYFGEISDEYENSEVVARVGSWLVGGPGPGDPPDTPATDTPALHLPAELAVGDTWTEESLPQFQIHETRKVLRARKKVRTRTGKFRDCVQIKEKDYDGENEHKWYAPGTGVVKVRGDDEKLKLVATTLRPR